MQTSWQLIKLYDCSFDLLVLEFEFLSLLTYSLLVPVLLKCVKLQGENFGTFAAR